MTPETRRAVDALEAEDRDQNPDSFMPWDAGYRAHIGRMLDCVYGKMLTGNKSASKHCE